MNEERDVNHSNLTASLGRAKIYVYAKDVDMRKSFDGLHAIVQAEFPRDIRLGDLFLFLNRRLDRVKRRPRYRRETPQAIR